MWIQSILLYQLLSFLLHWWSSARNGEGKQEKTGSINIYGKCGLNLENKMLQRPVLGFRLWGRERDNWDLGDVSCRLASLVTVVHFICHRLDVFTQRGLHWSHWWWESSFWWVCKCLAVPAELHSTFDIFPGFWFPSRSGCKTGDCSPDVEGCIWLELCGKHWHMLQKRQQLLSFSLFFFFQCQMLLLACLRALVSTRGGGGANKV